jgi:hypothetical protein
MAGEPRPFSARRTRGCNAVVGRLYLEFSGTVWPGVETIVLLSESKPGRQT